MFVSGSKESFKKRLIKNLGPLLYDDWKSNIKKEDGTYEKRVKILAVVEKDGEKKKKWFNKGDVPEGASIIMEQDIANTSFKDLPKNWKKDNIKAATVVIDLVFDKLEKKENIDIEEASAVVHDKWLERNNWVYDNKNGNLDLAKPYEELSEKEKQKDRNHILRAIEVYKKNKKI